MFWDKKEENDEEGLPDLPPLKPGVASHSGLPEFKEEQANELEDSHSLPSFPDTPTERGFSQSAIKDAVETEEMPEAPEESRNTMEMEEWHPSEPEMPAEHRPMSPMRTPQNQEMPELPEFPEEPARPAPLHATTPRALSSSRAKQDVFVKIDKFHSAKKALIKAREKLDEIDALLKKIRETKMREEQELTTWERNLATAKSKIHDVTENIFEKA